MELERESEGKNKREILEKERERGACGAVGERKGEGGGGLNCFSYCEALARCWQLMMVV